MSDGAHQGIGAERALKTILGGEPQPTEEERETVEEMRARILSTPIESTSYDGAATACARLILEAWKKYPRLVEVPIEGRYLRDEEGGARRTRVTGRAGFVGAASARPLRGSEGRLFRPSRCPERLVGPDGLHVGLGRQRGAAVHRPPAGAEPGNSDDLPRSPWRQR